MITALFIKSHLSPFAGVYQINDQIAGVKVTQFNLSRFNIPTYFNVEETILPGHEAFRGFKNWIENYSFEVIPNSILVVDLSPHYTIQCNLVKIGLGLYGNVMSLREEVLQTPGIQWTHEAVGPNSVDYYQLVKFQYWKNR